MIKRILIIFFLLASVISFIWFRGNLLFGTAEEGIPFYRPTRTVEVYSNLFYDNGTGFIEPLTLPRAPVYYLSSLMGVFLPNYSVQYIIFALLIISATFGTYLFAKELGFSDKTSFIAGVFYFLNLFTMTQVWRRAVYAGIFTWAYLPIFLAIWARWLKEGEYKILFLFLLASFVFSYSYSNPGFLFTLWIPAFLYAFVSFIKKDKRARLISRSLFALFFWFVVNIWWIYPYIYSVSLTYNGHSLVDKNFESLQGVSVSFPLSEVFLLRQKGYFDSTYNPQIPNVSWKTWYESILPKFISYGIFAIAVFGWWKLRKKKYWLFLSLLALVGLFVSKGVNPPFGYSFYKLLFYNFPFTQTLRNSYEKFGVVWLLPYVLFFGVGVKTVFIKIKKRFTRLFAVGFAFFLFFGVLVWPVWTGEVFEDYYWIRVPEYYEEVNQYLIKDREDFRTLILPMIPDHGVAFAWGYRGDEPSISLFDKTMLSKRITYPLYTEKYDQLKNMSDKEVIDTKLFNELNIKYIILNKDIRWEIVGTTPVDKTEVYLDKIDQLENLGNFGNLKFYKLKDYDGSLITLKGENVPKYVYKKIRNTHYQVKIYNAKEPFTLVLKNTFSDLWQARVSKKVIDSHFIVYEYANGWGIDEKGNFIIDVSLKIWPWE